MDNSTSKRVDQAKQQLQSLTADEAKKLIEEMGYGSLHYEGNNVKGSIEFIIDSKKNIRFGKKNT